MSHEKLWPNWIFFWLQVFRGWIRGLKHTSTNSSEITPFHLFESTPSQKSIMEANLNRLFVPGNMSTNTIGFFVPSHRRVKKNNCLISSVQFLSFKISKKKNWRTALEAKDKVRGVVHQNQPSGPKRPISRNVNDWSMEKPGETPCVKLHLRLSSTKWHFFEVEDFNLSPWSFQIVTFCDAMNSPGRRSGNIRNSNKTKSLDVAYIVAIQPLHNKSHSLPLFLMCKTQEEADRAAP